MAASTSDSATTTTTATTDGPVLSVITKRLRALRKKLNRIHQMEESLSQGKTLNKEQLETLKSKSSLLTLIDELDKLRSPLSSALLEELSAAATNSSPPPPPPPQPVVSGDAVKDLVNLMYFGSLFDVKNQSEFTSLMLTRTHERGCCLTYDYVTDDVTELLGEKDLDLISGLQGLMVSRPVDSMLSHRNALEKCVEHASLWLAKSDQRIDDSSDVTYAALREKLNKIMASDYFTATPQMKGPGEVAAAAAGVGNFGSFEVPVGEPGMTLEVPVQVEGSVEQYHEADENVASSEEYEVVEDHSESVHDVQKDDLEPENPSEVVSAQGDQEQLQDDLEGQRTADFKEQQYFPRRGQRGSRGGGGGRRGGYLNGRGGRGSGRGGGPYQNGRSQYYDNYYPRNYYNRRGGRGGGGNSYHNHSSSAQGNYNHADVGVAS